MPQRIGVAIYQAIARVAPAPYVENMLARAGLARGDISAARTYARRLPQGESRSELLGLAAQAQGDHRSAQRYFIQAGDVFAIEREVDSLSGSDAGAAYELELELKNRLEQGGTHPDGVAEASWRLGVLSAQAGNSARAMDQYREAARLSPISAKYLLAAGFQAYDLRSDAEARAYFESAMSVDPQSADAFAGAGLVALRAGDRAAATRYAELAGTRDPHSHALETLEAQLH